MTLAQVIAWLSGSEMLSTDNIVIKTADGVSHAVAAVYRTGDTQNTLPAGPDTPPCITIQLA